MYTVLNDKATPFKFDITFGLDGSRPDASHITAVVAGPTGAGKSTRVRTMLQEYARVYGQANVRFFILTHHERDPAYDGLEPAILRIPYERVMAESDAERASKRARTTRARESAAAAATAADDTSDNDGSQAVEDPFADADDLAGAQSAVRDAGIAIIAPLGVDVPVLDINPDELISGFTGGLMDVEGHAGIHALPVSKLLEYDAYHARGVRTVIVFDDADFSGDKRVDAAIHRFKTMCMSYGRKCKISTVVVAHAIMSGRTTSAFLKEAAWKIMFPGTTLGQADALQYFVDKRRWAPAMAQQFLVAMACQPWLLVCEIEPAFMLSPCCLVRM